MSDRWLKLYTGLARHPKWRLRLPDDAARVAYVIALMAAKEAGADGRFESREHLSLVLGTPYAESIDAMIEAGLIDEIPDTGELWMHDFEARQAPIDRTSKERARRYRERRGGGGSNGVSPPVDKPVEKPSRRDATVTQRESNAVTQRDANDAVTKKSRVTVQREEKREIRSTYTETARANADDDEFDALVTALIMANVWTKPTRKMLAMLSSLIRDHGQSMVEKAIAEELPAGTDDLFARVGKRCRLWAREAVEKADESRRASEIAADKAIDERIAAAPLEEKERAADHRAQLAEWMAGFGEMEGSA